MTPSAASVHPYLDHNATTPPAPEVIDAVARAQREAWGNPSSGHAAGRAARAALARATEEVAALIGADPDEIVFVSGGTEANDLAIRGTAAAAPPERRKIVTSPIEHPSVLGPIEALAAEGFAIEHLPVDERGQVGRQGAARALDASVALLTVMLANNETGVLQPVAELADRARAVGAAIHTDAAQAAGKIPVDVAALGVDLLTVVGHKLYGPKGIAALYVRRGTRLAPRLLGGGQQRGLRPGTEPVPAIVGLGVAAALARASLGEEATRQAALRDQLEALLRARVPGIRITGGSAPRLPNTLHVRFPRASGARLLARAATVAASTGSACHEGQASPVLAAMGVTDEDAAGSVRLSVGRSTTTSDVAAAAAALAEAWSGIDGDR